MPGMPEMSGITRMLGMPGMAGIQKME